MANADVLLMFAADELSDELFEEELFEEDHNMLLVIPLLIRCLNLE